MTVGISPEKTEKHLESRMCAWRWKAIITLFRELASLRQMIFCVWSFVFRQKHKSLDKSKSLCYMPIFSSRMAPYASESMFSLPCTYSPAWKCTIKLTWSDWAPSPQNGVGPLILTFNSCVVLNLLPCFQETMPCWAGLDPYINTLLWKHLNQMK